MIRYHGTPITPISAASEILRCRHGMVSFAHPQQVSLVAEVCQSFVLDNGAFSFWKSKKETNWPGFFSWAKEWSFHPGLDWILAPDVIDGSEQDNDELLNETVKSLPIHLIVPVFHLHESIDRLERLANNWRRVAIGSSGAFSSPGSEKWEERMNDCFEAICDKDGHPITKVHGLRMMNPTLFSRYPFSSVDSCQVARNIGIDKKWDSFTYGRGLSKSARGVMMARRCEEHASASVWKRSRPEQYRLLFG